MKILGNLLNVIDNPNLIDKGFKPIIIIAIICIGAIMLLFTKFYLDNRK